MEIGNIYKEAAYIHPYDLILSRLAYYGIEHMKMTRKKLFAIMQRFVNESYRILQENGLGGEERKYKAMFIFYFGKFTLESLYGIK